MKWLCGVIPHLHIKSHSLLSSDIIWAFVGIFLPHIIFKGLFVGGVGYWDGITIQLIYIYIYYDMIADASSLISAPFVIFGSGFRCTLKWLTPVFNFLPNFVPRNVPGVGHRRCASCLSQWLELIESHWLNSVG